MTAPKEIIRLVENFDRHRDEYRAAAYNEAQVRKEFIDPFFEALGWDMANRSGKAEAYKDVLHEASLKMPSGATKAPDYAFRIGGNAKFFLEAKKPSHDIKEEIDPAYQLRRYAWSAKLPLSVLTDFEEFAVYDCRIRPRPTDKADRGRIQFWTCRDFIDKWDEIAGIFSKDAIEQGSFDKFVESAAGKRGTSEVDAEFLSDIEKWRDDLAHNIASRNRKLSVDDLNNAVQRTIDRIIFLRMCEDRGIESYGQLQRLLDDEYIYSGLLTLYGRADEKYNSGLFYFEHEKGRGEPDTLTPSLNIDNEILKKIIASLYYPDCPYEFSVLPAEILGNVYEQFLGKVIRLYPSGLVKVEDKPEVTKAGGVYYTPKYIVDYIVNNTVERLCKGKTPKQIDRLRILDPACGSGSFLLGAYTYLLDYHRDWYAKRWPKQFKKEMYRDKLGQLHLATAEKKRILLNNIYGVDIDPQAVEVTKLSLLLKILEGENASTLEQQRLPLDERALPDLDNNMKCGNSLIGTDFYKDGGQRSLFKDMEVKRDINAFDWEREFSDVCKEKNGGFDAIIGNPPYGALFTDLEKKYLFDTYHAIKGQPESYEYFLYRAISLSTKRGFVSFILPTNFIESQRAEQLRRTILNGGYIHSISNFRYNVWNVNAAETLVIVFQNGVQGHKTRVTHPTSPTEFTEDADAVEFDQDDWLHTEANRFLIRANSALIRKIEAKTIRLDKICDLTQGIIVYKTREEGIRNAYISDKAKGSAWKKLLDTNSTVQRYSLSWGKQYLKYGEWLWCPRDPKYFEQPKIVLVRLRNKALARKLIGTYDEKKFYNRDNFNDIILKDTRYSLKYILGLFNSCLLNYWYKTYFDNVNINPAQVKLIPIKPIDFSNKADKGRHDKMVNLVDGMLALYKQIAKAKDVQTRKVIQRQIDSTDKDIDELVYELYGLTEKEIAVVEGK